MPVGLGGGWVRFVARVDGAIIYANQVQKQNEPEFSTRALISFVSPGCRGLKEGFFRANDLAGAGGNNPRGSSSSSKASIRMRCRVSMKVAGPATGAPRAELFSHFCFSALPPIWAHVINLVPEYCMSSSCALSSTRVSKLLFLNLGLDLAAWQGATTKTPGTEEKVRHEIDQDIGVH